MYPLLKHVHGSSITLLSHYSHLINQCLSLNCVYFAKTIHAQLIKSGLNGNTFLGNLCVELYAQFGPVGNVLKVFDEINKKNTISWNICLKGLLNFGHFDTARLLFDEMPVRDVVSWNSMISGFISCGLDQNALDIFSQMQNNGLRPSGHTYSILMSVGRSTLHVKQIHGNMLRSGINLSNLVLGNSLIDTYGKLGFVDYAFGVFFTMKDVDVITWNSLILGCHRSGLEELALDQFRSMRRMDQSPDHFTISIVISVCCSLQDFEKGKQIFAFCFKVGFLSNSIISSATIDLFSKCNNLNDAVKLFEELDKDQDRPVCNSMISSYALHGLGHNALCLFASVMMENNLNPCDVTLSSLLSSVSVLMSVEMGIQIHTLVVKLGFEDDSIVSSSLMDLYTKFGLVTNAMKIFADMGVKDLISWNTMIMGLAYNGKEIEALHVFIELVRKGLQVDRITLSGVLLACKYGGFVNEGMWIFSSMEKVYGIKPVNEHYSCMVDLLSRAGKLNEAMDIMEAMSYKPNSVIYESFLQACVAHGDLKLTERVAEKVMELVPDSFLPYMVLIRAYEMRGRWESVVRVRNMMKRKVVKKVDKECSWIGIQNRVYTFKGDQLEHHGGKDIYLVLRLLIWEIEDEQ